MFWLLIERFPVTSATVSKILSKNKKLNFYYIYDSTSLSPQSGFDVTYFYHQFHLKATKCQKGTTDSTACKFRNDRVSFVCF